MGSTTPEITLYTSHACPWAHRSQIALRELSLPFTTSIIDLSVPRPDWYLKINPRGLVPALSYNGHIITESAVISQFLVDAHPSHLEKTSSEEGGALQRARINFFVETYAGKVNTLFFGLVVAKGEEKVKLAGQFVEVVKKEIEPLLHDAAPFFGGAPRLTFAEVQTASFLLRLLSFPKHPELLPSCILTDLESKTPNFYKWANEVIKQESVTYIWDEAKVAEGTKKRLAKMA